MFFKTIKKKIEEIKQEGYELIEGTDNYLAIVDDLASVSKIIKMVSMIRIPHRDYEFVPFELAVDVKEIKEQEIENINRKEIIQFYKNDIVNSYKRYYKSRYNNDSIKETFVVYTKELHKELQLKSRDLFSKEIQFDNRIFSLADLEIMQDIESTIHENKINVEKFKVRVTNATIGYVAGDLVLMISFIFFFYWINCFYRS